MVKTVRSNAYCKSRPSTTAFVRCSYASNVKITADRANFTASGLLNVVLIIHNILGDHDVMVRYICGLLCTHAFLKVHSYVSKNKNNGSTQHE
jgi:hypothetical protein